MTKAFTETIHCTSHVHCFACCHNQAWREGMIKTFGAFSCPLGLPLGAPRYTLPEPATAALAPPPCRYRVDTGVQASQDKPCLGTIIDCQCPSPGRKDGIIGQVLSKKCCPEGCNLYTLPLPQEE